ncbi:translocation/assembly module TamB [Phenylobacterium deserti]|uniref:Translocation/assembly module TamB n=2 Tax=Phenylobacterium deserti TaxID=1914756 RepID=A0A328AHU8_9CAUL|nr:translocation/assembly module TamB [Phenylobacterium deserti]
MPEAEAPPQEPARRSIRRALLSVFLGALILFGGVFLGTRYGVLIPQTRLLIEARTDGLKIGRFGRLKVEGLAGDVWRDFTVRRLTIRDEQGVWLEANNVHMTWRYAELLRRRFHADRIEIQSLKVLRRPMLTPKGKDRGLPVSFFIDEAHARVEMLPAFSYRRGVYDVDLELAVQRGGGQRGSLKAASILHAGDHLNVEFDIAKTRPLVLVADGEEVQGGAIAGALGLPANQPFSLKAVAGGRLAEGRFTAVARSGAVEPLNAQGAWTRQGGQASGRVLLTSSTLLRDYARRFGPSAEFQISGAKSGPEYFALRGEVRAENLNFSAQGFGDIGERELGPGGLSIVASTRQLSRLTGGPTVGASRSAGVLTKSRDTWRYKGTFTAGGLDLWGYYLPQASGPIEGVLKNRLLTAKGSLTSRDGRGDSLFAVFMGAAPRGVYEIQRLPDGRILGRDVHILGNGLKLDAEGGRTLFGGLTFKGKAVLSKLEQANFGGMGGAVATWSALQRRDRQPWDFDVKADGQNFAMGYVEFDRMAGRSPKLRFKASYLDEHMTFTGIRFDGAAATVNARGVMGPNFSLDFKGDWSASGPFRVGPVEITGRGAGTGTVTGTVERPRADLIADVPEVDVPRLPLRNAHILMTFTKEPYGTGGAVSLTADSAYGPARWRSDMRLLENSAGVDLFNISAEGGGVQASGSLSLRSDEPSAADLRVNVGKGALLDAGRVGGTVRIVDAPGGPRGDLDLAGDGMRLPGANFTIRSLKLSADGPMARLPYTVEARGASGAGAWRLAGRGALSQVRTSYTVAFDGGGSLGERDLRTTETAVITFNENERTGRLRLASSEGGRVVVDGRFTAAEADLRAQLSGVALSLLNEDLAGGVNGTLSLQGREGRLDGTFMADLKGARSRGAPAASGVDGVVRGRLADNTLSLEAIAANGQGLRANASLVLPTEASAAPFRVAIARRRPMQGRFFAEGEVRPLFDLLVGGERSLSGQVRSEGTLGGTLADPTALGRITVENGRFDDGNTGLSLRQVALRAVFDDDEVDVTQASGVDGRGGSVSGSGRISLERAGVSSFRLDLRSFRLIDNEQATASASGPATIARDANGRVRLSGDLTIDRADIAAELPTPSGVVMMDVVERNRPDEMQVSLPPANLRGFGWNLDVTLRAPRRIFLRGHGLDMELSLEARVRGTTNEPELSGAARVVRGDYEFAGRRFEFDQSGVVYLSTDPADIRLDLTATRDDPSLTAVTRIRGTAERPEITFTSSPSLPSDEVLSQVLFGRSASQLSPIEAAQLASALSALSRGGGFDVIGNLRSFAGLDRLAFGGGGDTAMTVSGGKYLTDDVYLELTGGGREGPSAQVEWRVRRNLSILSRLQGQGSARLAVRWRRDY